MSCLCAVRKEIHSCRHFEGLQVLLQSGLVGLQTTHHLAPRRVCHGQTNRQTDTHLLISKLSITATYKQTKQTHKQTNYSTN